MGRPCPLKGLSGTDTVRSGTWARGVGLLTTAGTAAQSQPCPPTDQPHSEQHEEAGPGSNTMASCIIRLQQYFISPLSV